MKWFLISLTMISFLMSEGLPEQEVGRYQIFVTEVISTKTGKQYLVETILDTKNGEVVKRTKIRFYKYKLPYLIRVFNETQIDSTSKVEKDTFDMLGIPLKEEPKNSNSIKEENK